MIAISIVSHGHGLMVSNLVNQLLSIPEVSQIIITFNIPELVHIPENPYIKLINNIYPQGFGENHNKAFKLCDQSFFCVLNPDITFEINPFPVLISSILLEKVALVSPAVKNMDGTIEDNARLFPSPFSILLRKFIKYKDAYRYRFNDPIFYPEWVAGMCMLFKSESYAALSGFDERYYLYVEDIDICTRIWLNGYQVLLNPAAIIIHNAQRASRTNWRHIRWHVSGLLRYFSKYTGRLPDICN